MPKLLVLFAGSDPAASALADAAAEGARGVRFMEVDVRAVGGPGEGGRREVESAEVVAGYDGIVVAGAGDECDALLLELGSRPRAELEQKIGAGVTAGGEALPAVTAMLARVGLVIVPQEGGGEAEDRARRVGRRVAEVVGWAVHMRSHQHSHHHHH